MPTASSGIDRLAEQRPLTPNTEVEVWLLILHPDHEMTPKLARAILNPSFPDSDAH